MHPHRDADRRWPAPLAGRVALDAGAAEIADAALALWRDIDDVLHPIVGRRGVAALYSRSLKACTTAFPWLAAVQPDQLAAVDLSALRAALARQPAADAAAAGVALFEAFRELLASLVGDSLTERLLHPVWGHSAGDPSAQDTSS